MLEIFSKKYCTFSYVGDLIPNGYIDTCMIPNILKVYDEIEKNQIFGTKEIKEIKEILDCSPSTARAVMTKLRDMKVVKAVNGKGKGKYVFIE